MSALKETGTLSQILFLKDAFLIGAFRTEGGKKIKAKGNMVNPKIGMRYELVGDKEFHNVFGETLVFESYKSVLPEDEDAVRSYLAESCESVGPVIARRITDAFGDEALRVCKEDPVIVAKTIKGITLKRANEISSSLKEVEKNEELVVELKKITINTGIGWRKIVRIIAKWGEESLEKIRKNPYALKGIEGIGFQTADAVAKNIGYDEESFFRILAGAEHVLQEEGKTGHTYTEEDILIEKVQSILRIDLEIVKGGILDAVERKKISRNPIQYKRLSLPRILLMEIEISSKVRSMLTRKPIPASKEIDLFDLKEDQQEAVGKSLNSNVFILTGAPGTGKTFTVRKILSLFYGKKCALCAPTGKAANRLSEMTGEGAKTIHRLLEGSFAAGEYNFSRCEQNQLDHDVVIMDEASMVDVEIFHSLVMAIKESSRLILIGDTNQLPSVGAGKILQDLIEGGVPSYSLEKIKRQDPGLIIKNCHRIKNGSSIEINNNSDDFFFIERQEIEDIRSEIVSLVAGERLSKKFRIDPLKDVQVLSPLREKTVLSCMSLNSILQKRMNDKCDTDTKRKIWTGDKVIQTKNDYDIGIMNGDMGFVYEITGKDVHVKFENSRSIILKNSGIDLDLAYALTVHKFQGSEVPVVVIPVHKCLGPIITQRNWLYTAISRAKLACVLVGQPQEAEDIIRRNKHVKRRTNLGLFME